MKIWLALVLFVQSPWAWGDTLPELLDRFSHQKELHASFIETWMASYLEEPVVTKGRLTYRAPGELSKFIEQPEKIEQHIRSDQLILIRDGETQTIQLSSQPKLATGIYALRDVLEGDLEKVQERFIVNYSENLKDWVLALAPKDEDVASHIKEITLRGQANRIHQTTIQYRNGDMLKTEIKNDR